MQIPSGAEVKPFDQAGLGALLVGRFRNEEPNFVAIRTELRESTGDPNPYLAVLTPWVDGRESPYLCAPEFDSTKVLDLGNIGAGWSVDVSIDENVPAFTLDRSAILFRQGSNFFIHLRNERTFLELASGSLITTLPDPNNVAAWSAFTLNLSQPGVDGPGAKIFGWPRERARERRARERRARER